jgi:Clp amino terminal domain, pathogenicity island component
MLERYTEKARRAIFFGRYEASQFGSPYIETEHLLLGLLREDKRIVLLFFRSHVVVEEIRKKIEHHTNLREKIATSVDLPLSNESKRVLAYAAEEAERLTHTHIGTEHLLLGLLREKESLAAHSLNEQGLIIEDARKRVGEGVAKGVLGGGLPGGQQPANLFLRMQVDQLRKFEWHKREWKTLDVFRHDETGLASFDPRLRDDPNFKFVPGGWPKDWCAICNWEFNDNPEHSSGYTNGRQWICPKCYDGFFGPAAGSESR